MSGAGKKRGAASAGSGSSSKKQMGEKDLMRDLEGWWALDLARSDTMEAFLKKMGMGEIPILAAAKHLRQRGVPAPPRRALLA